MKHSSRIYNFSLLDAAEMALGVSALSGALAVLALVLLSWPLALIATMIAVAMLVVAVVLLTIPPAAPAVSKKENQEEKSFIPKDLGVELSHDFTHSTRQILESTTLSIKAASIETEPVHYASPLASSKAIEAKKMLEEERAPDLINSP